MKTILIYLGAMFVLALILLFIKWRTIERENNDPSATVESYMRYQLVKFWDNEKSRYSYQLQEGTVLISRDGHEHMRAIYDPYNLIRQDRDGWRPLATGDLFWAKRAAKHYGIDVPTKATE